MKKLNVSMNFSGSFIVNAAGSGDDFSAYLEVLPTGYHSEPFWSGCTYRAGDYEFRLRVAIEGETYTLLPRKAWLDWCKDIKDHAEDEEDISEVINSIWVERNLRCPELGFEKAFKELEEMLDQFLWVSKAIDFSTNDNAKFSDDDN